MMSESTELTTIRNLALELETALQGVDRSLVYYLNRQSFINDAVCSDVLDPRSMLNEVQKAGELVKAIKKRVTQEPRDYHKLLDHLKEYNTRTYQPIVEKLDNEHQRLEGTGCM